MSIIEFVFVYKFSVLVFLFFSNTLNTHFVCSLILSIKLTINRYNYELKNAGVELAMSYKDIVNISLHSQLSVKETLNTFKKEGKITSIAIQEDTLRDLKYSEEFISEYIYFK